MSAKKSKVHSSLYKTGVINDPLGQTHSHANIVFCCFVFLDLKSGDGRTDGRTTCAKTMIPTGRDFGLVEWIISYKIVKNTQKTLINF